MLNPESTWRKELLARFKSGWPRKNMWFPPVQWLQGIRQQGTRCSPWPLLQPKDQSPPPRNGKRSTKKWRFSFHSSAVLCKMLLKHHIEMVRSDIEWKQIAQKFRIRISGLEIWLMVRPFSWQIEKFQPYYKSCQYSSVNSICLQLNILTQR